jgi:uncharacterized surface protein with fasciclin (FAS1) repeats
MRSRACVGVALIAGLLTVSAVACGTSPPSPAKFTGAPHLPTVSPTSVSKSAHVGTNCGFIPRRGAGSFRSMSAQRAVVAVSSNPQLSVFTSAIQAAALVNELNSMRSLTLFVPVNSAFAALSKQDITFLRNPANLVKVVRRLAVPVRITPTLIAHGGSVTTLSGSTLTLAKRGPSYRVNQATVLCGNIRTANGTFYVIDRVLLPSRHGSRRH